jgi:hypothetical protein
MVTNEKQINAQAGSINCGLFSLVTEIWLTIMFNETYNIKGTSKTARGCFDKKVQYFYT